MFHEVLTGERLVRDVNRESVMSDFGEYYIYFGHGFGTLGG